MGSEERKKQQQLQQQQLMRIKPEPDKIEIYSASVPAQPRQLELRLVVPIRVCHFDGIVDFKEKRILVNIAK